MKIYILLILLLFTSCVSNNLRTKSNKNLEVTVREQGIEFKKLQDESKELKKDIENLNKRIQKIEDFYESN